MSVLWWVGVVVAGLLVALSGYVLVRGTWVALFGPNEPPRRTRRQRALRGEVSRDEELHQQALATFIAPYGLRTMRMDELGHELERGRGRRGRS